MSRRKKILIVAGTLLVVAVFVSVIHHFQLRWGVEQYVFKLKASGEQMDLAQLIPRPLPVEENSAPLFLKAASLLQTNTDVLATNPPLPMHMAAPGKAIVRWMQPDTRSQFGTNSWEQIKEALAPDDAALKLIERITNSPAFDFDVQYSQRFNMQLKHLALERKFASTLSAATVYDLQAADTTSAVRNVHVLLAIVKGMHEERIAISQLVRIAIANIAFAANWELMQAHNLNDSELAALQSDWAGLEFVKAAHNALPVEREGSRATLEKWRSSNSELQIYLNMKKIAFSNLIPSDEPATDDSIFAKIKTKTQIFLWRYWSSYSDELRGLKGFSVLINTLRSVESRGSFKDALLSQNTALEELGISKLRNSLDSLFSNRTDFDALSSESIVTLAGVIEKVMRIECSKQMTITAIALERFRLKYDHLPPDLNLLVPEFVQSVPLDPVDGNPLRYHLKLDGSFLLYSIGENGLDDGGNSENDKSVRNSNSVWLLDNHALDWVWPQRATEVEVKAYYKKPSSKSN